LSCLDDTPLRQIAIAHLKANGTIGYVDLDRIAGPNQADGTRFGGFG
jgi:hypothetical protein